MKTMKYGIGLACFILGLGFTRNLPAAEPAQPKMLLKKGCRLAIVDEGLIDYGKDMELYLTVCTPELQVNVLKLFGRGIADLKVRLPLELVPFKPDVVTTCFGFGDGHVCAFTDKNGAAYSKTLEEVVETLSQTGATVVVGSSFAADTHYFKGLRETSGAPLIKDSDNSATVYNQTLSQFAALGKAVAEKNQMPFADVHATMCDVMEKAKAALGQDYDVCGISDKYPSPAANGQLVIASVFLKALGLDGSIGTISVDMNGPATASDGHKILSSDKGAVEIESSRYPFCFSGDEKSSAGTRSIMPFVPFNQELNRFMLVVKNLKSEKASVTWGAASKTFTRQELEGGINLAAAFADGNPFSEPFKKVEAAVSARQDAEKGIRDTITNLKSFKFEPADEAFVEETCRVMLERREKQAGVLQALVVPVKHKLTVAAVN